MISAIAAILSIIGAWLNAHKDIRCFIFWIIANVLWIIYSIIIIKDVWLLIMFSYYLIISIRGIVVWKKDMGG